MSCFCQSNQNTSCTSCQSSASATNCAVKDLSTDCVLYTGDTLACSGIVTDTSLSDLIVQLDSFVCTKFDEVTGFFQVTNVGTGSQVYRGISGTGAKEFRTILSDNTDLLDVIQSADTINIKAGSHSLGFDSETNILSLSVQSDSGSTDLSAVDLSSLDGGSVADGVITNVELNSTNLNFTGSNGGFNGSIDLSSLTGTGEANTAFNIGSGLGIFNQKTGLNLELKSLVAGTNVTLTDLGNTIQVNSSFTQQTATNIGTGEDVYVNSSSPFQFKRIQAKDSSITVETVTDSILIGTPTVVEQIDRSASFTLDNTMNDQVVFINNGTTNITITVPTLNDNFKAGFVQLGTGDVIFSTSGTTLRTKDGFKIQGENHQTFIQKINSSGEYILLGNTKI